MWKLTRLNECTINMWLQFWVVHSIDRVCLYVGPLCFCQCGFKQIVCLPRLDYNQMWQASTCMQVQWDELCTLDGTSIISGHVMHNHPQAGMVVGAGIDVQHMMAFIREVGAWGGGTIISIHGHVEQDHGLPQGAPESPSMFLHTTDMLMQELLTQCERGQDYMFFSAPIGARCVRTSRCHIRCMRVI